MLCLNLTCHVLEISASIRASDDGPSYTHTWPCKATAVTNSSCIGGHIPFLSCFLPPTPSTFLATLLEPGEGGHLSQALSKHCSHTRPPAVDSFQQLTPSPPSQIACLGAFSDTRSLARAIEVGTEGGLLSQGQTSTSWGGSGETNTPDSPSPARQGFPKGWSPPHPLGEPAP